MTYYGTILLILISIFPAHNVSGQVSGLPAEVAIPGSAAREVASKINGVHYKISVFLPRGYESGSSRYPVLYVIPGDTFGASFAQMTRILSGGDIPPLLVVGIEFPEKDSYSMDLPTAGPDPHWTVPDNRGADNFLKFLLQQVKPYIDSTYRTNPDDNGLFGHSMGGFFAFYAYLHSGGVFQHVYASSPSVIWQDQKLLRDVQSIAASHGDLIGRVFIDQGALEEQDGRLDALDRAVTSSHFPALHWEFRTAANQTHRTLPFTDGMDALYSIYGPKERAVPDEELRSLAGAYCTDGKNKFSLEAKDHRLFMVGSPDSDDDPQSLTILLSSSANQWFIRYLNYTMSTALNSDGTYHVKFQLRPTPGPNGGVSTREIHANLCGFHN